MAGRSSSSQSFEFDIQTRKILRKGHPSFDLALLIVLRGVGGGRIPAEHTAADHCFFLRRRDAAPLVVVIDDLPILFRVPRLPFGRVIAAFAALDADNFAGRGQGRKTDFRKL